MIAQWRYSEPFFPHASDFMTGPETRGVTLSWHSCTELHQYRPHNSCLHYHYQLCSSSNQVSKSQVKFTLCATALRKRAAKKGKRLRYSISCLYKRIWRASIFPQTLCFLGGSWFSPLPVALKKLNPRLQPDEPQQSADYYLYLTQIKFAERKRQTN